MVEYGSSPGLKELVHRLPELLEGDEESVLRRPGVVGYLHRHPEGRAYVLAAAELVHALNQHESRGPRAPMASRSPFRRSIEAASIHFPRQLVQLFFDAALAHVSQHYQSGSDYVLLYGCDDWPDLATQESRASGLESLAESLELPRAEQRRAAATLSEAKRMTSPADAAKLLLNACEDLIPGLEGVDIWSTILANRGSAEDWTRRASSYAGHSARAAALDLAAVITMQSDRVAGSLSLSEEARQLSRANPVYAFNAMIAAITCNHHADAIRNAIDLTSLLGNGGDEEAGLCRSVPQYATALRRTGSPSHALNSLLNRLPTAIAESLERVLSCAD